MANIYRMGDTGAAPSPEPERMTGAEMVIRALQDQGVEHLFGYPGGAVLPIYDACSTRTRSSTSWCAMSRARCMRLRAMPAPPARSAACW